ncbi:MAG: hypothetical protein JXB88_18755 [Spirochaetales bacterium]|nr:hypothetical protein [Spirochaetales bacterium]
MKHDIEDQFQKNLNEQLKREAALEKKHKELEIKYSGLKDIDERYSLISLKLTISLAIINKIESFHPGQEILRLQDIARDKAREAVQLLEDLIDTNISEDQKELILKAPGYKEAKELLQQLILKGGGLFFKTRLDDEKKIRKIAKIINRSIRKFLNPDDNYTPLFKTEELSGFLRTLIDTFLPVFGKPYQKPPPDGIEEGEEVFYSSKKMRLPLSQAIHYLEHEVLPGLKKKLEDSPYDREIQRELYNTEKKIYAFKQLKFIPRSSPVFPEKGYYSDGLTGYTADGEMLVTLSTPVIYKSGTNLERMQEMVCAEITRRLAGKGLCPELDSEYEYLKRIESGMKGNSRTPSLKLNTSMGFKMLKNLYPFLAKLENKRIFKKLLHYVSKTDKKYTEKLIRQFILEDEYNIKALP